MLLLLVILHIEHENPVNVLARCSSSLLRNLLPALGDGVGKTAEHIVVVLSLRTLMRELFEHVSDASECVFDFGTDFDVGEEGEAEDETGCEDPGSEVLLSVRLSKGLEGLTSIYTYYR